MKAVNLLPEKDRPRVASGARSGSAYVVLGVLGLGLLALVAFVLTANQVTSQQAQTEQAKREADAAGAKAAQLGSFGSFAEMKKTRLESVKSLSTERFDWERLALEISRVTPPNVFLSEINASTTGDKDASSGGSSGSSSSSSKGSGSSSGSSGSASASSSSAGAAGAPGEAVKPTMTVIGCAQDQPDVATTMVRLRLLHRAEEVKLTESVRGEETSNPAASGTAAAPAAPAPASGAAPAPAPAGGASAGASEEGDGCGETRGVPNYKFTVDITFAPAEEKTSKGSVRAPATLGGGS